MDIFIFALITLLVNNTDLRIHFSLHQSNVSCPVRPVKPGGSRTVKQDTIRQQCASRASSTWMIDVYIDGLFTGIQIKAADLLTYVMIVFDYREGTTVVRVTGVKEKPIDNFLYGRKYIGFMRKSKWEKRDRIEIGSADSKEAVKLKRERQGAANDGHLSAPASADVLSMRSESIADGSQSFSSSADATITNRQYLSSETDETDHYQHVTKETEKYSDIPTNVATAVPKDAPSTSFNPLQSLKRSGRSNSLRRVMQYPSSEAEETDHGQTKETETYSDIPKNLKEHGTRLP